MENSSLDKELLDLYTFVRLHGWKSQTGQLLNAFVENFLEATSPEGEKTKASILQYTDSILKSDGTSREKILSLLLYHKLGKGYFAIAENFYRHLYGNIGQEDFSFLFSELFIGKNPLPNDLSYDISIRNFISYKRAIYHAMQIDHFQSVHTPEMTALFFVCLLCKNDVKEQNKALICYLLSRIDVDLPANIESGVMNYLSSLQDIIEEVEKRKEAVLSDPLFFDDEPSTSTNAVKKNTKSNDAPGIYHAHIDTRHSTEHTDIFNPIVEDHRFFPESKKKRTAMSSNNPSETISNKSLRFLHAHDILWKIKRVNADKEKLQDSKSILKHSARKNDTTHIPLYTQVNINTEEKTIKKDEEVKNVATTFTVEFSRNRIPGKFLEQDIKKNNLSKKTVKRHQQKYSCRIIAFIVLLIIVMGLIAILFHEKKPSSKEIGKPNTTINTGIQTPDSHPVISDRKSYTQASSTYTNVGPYTFVWYPSKGESLWVLYQEIKNDPHTTWHKALSAANSGWTEFLNYILSINPEITSPDLIYPENPITVEKL